MPKVLDEDERLNLLALIAAHYPDKVEAKAMAVEDPEVLRATLAYMEEKHLIKVFWAPALAGKEPMFAVATASGYDVAEKCGAI